MGVYAPYLTLAVNSGFLLAVILTDSVSFVAYLCRNGLIKPFSVALYFTWNEVQSVHSIIVGFDSCVPIWIDDKEQKSSSSQ